MQEENNNENATPENEGTKPSSHSTNMQEKSDPQLTELKGFFDSKEDLEPTLQDGTKSNEKPPPEDVNK